MKALDKSGSTRQFYRQHETLKTLSLALGQHLKYLNMQDLLRHRCVPRRCLRQRVYQSVPAARRRSLSGLPG